MYLVKENDSHKVAETQSFQIVYLVPLCLCGTKKRFS